MENNLIASLYIKSFYTNTLVKKWKTCKNNLIASLDIKSFYTNTPVKKWKTCKNNLIASLDIKSFYTNTPVKKLYQTIKIKNIHPEDDFWLMCLTFFKYCYFISFLYFYT